MGLIKYYRNGVEVEGPPSQMVYIVTRGEYSDYEITGVFLKEELARTWAAQLDEDEDADVRPARVEPWPITESLVWGPAEVREGEA